MRCLLFSQSVNVDYICTMACGMYMANVTYDSNNSQVAIMIKIMVMIIIIDYDT